MGGLVATGGFDNHGERFYESKDMLGDGTGISRFAALATAPVWSSHNVVDECVIVTKLCCRPLGRRTRLRIVIPRYKPYPQNPDVVTRV